MREQLFTARSEKRGDGKERKERLFPVWRETEMGDRDRVSSLNGICRTCQNTSEPRRTLRPVILNQSRCRALSVKAEIECPWIPGLTVLARNDGQVVFVIPGTKEMEDRDRDGEG